MKVQIVIKQGKETETYLVPHNNPKEWIKHITNLIEYYQGTSLVFIDQNEKTICIGVETIKNSIIEFKEIKT